MQMRTPPGSRFASLGAAALMLAGCAAGDALPPIPPDHPASARAQAAAIPYVPSPFDADPAESSTDHAAMPGMHHEGSMNDMGSMHDNSSSEEAHHADH